MNDPVRFLTSFSQALSTLGLYGGDHPATVRACEAAYRHLSDLQAAAGKLEFTFLPGEVLFGRDLAELDEDRRARLRRGRVSLVFQAFHLLPNMTAEENIAAPLEIDGKRDAMTTAGTWLQRVGLGARTDHYPRTLSGGEQQRVAIARAFSGEPSLLMADEPTGNLDGVTGAELADLMFTLNRERGTTLLLVTHDDTLARRCDRRLSLASGRLVDDVRQAETRIGGR